MQPAGGDRVEFPKLLVERFRAEFLRLPHQLAAQRPVGGRPLEDAVEQAAQVERRAADEQRRPAARADFLEGGAGALEVSRQAEGFVGVHDVEEMEWNALPDRARGLACADVEASVHFHRIH